MNQAIILAHRGLTDEAPENSYEAVANTVARGIAGLEVDVRASSDGKLFLCHDDNAARLCGLDKKFADMPAEEIRHLKWTRLSRDGQTKVEGRPLFFNDLLDMTRDKLLLNLEVKGGAWKSKLLQEKFIQPLIDRHMLGQVIVSSFLHQPLLQLRRIAPELKTGFIIHPSRFGPGQPGWTARWLKLYSIHPPKGLVTPTRIALWKRNGYTIFVWTVNEKKQYEQLCEWEVDGIISDVPERLG